MARRVLLVSYHTHTQVHTYWATGFITAALGRVEAVRFEAFLEIKHDYPERRITRLVGR